MNELTSDFQSLSMRLQALSTKCEEAEELVKRETLPRIERIDTMLAALDRDLKEVRTPDGADMSTAAALAANIQKEIDDLEPEVEALLLGNPTTVSAALDASSQAFEQVGEAISKVTSKISLRS